MADEPHDKKPKPIDPEDEDGQDEDGGVVGTESSEPPHEPDDP